MANHINAFVDNVHLNISNSFTHILDAENNDELNSIRCSPYSISSDDLVIQSRENCENGLSIVSMNCQSLHAKFDYIRLLIDKFANNNCALQVLCLQESWFSSETDLSPYIIPGYHMISTGHYASNHGGLVMYLNKKWEYKLIAEGTDLHNNLRDNLNTFMGEFNATLLENNANSQNTYMCGDYNVDLLKVNNTQFNDDYFHNILSAGYIPKVTLPTRLSENSTLIDNVFTTNLNSDLSAYILDIHISDHQPVVLFTNDDIPPTRSKYITIRANTDDRKDNFRQCFHNKYIFDQLDKDIHVTDPNYNYEILEHAIKDTHSECFPERRVRFNAKKHKKTPWITNGILKSINNRNKLYKKLKQSRIDSINYIAKKTDFNKYRNTLSKTITNAKRVYYNQIFDRYKYDMKKTWNIISETLNKKVKNPIPETMTINGQDCSDKGTIAESFNTFFASIGKQNELNIRTHQGSHFGDYLTGANNCNFAFHLIDNTTTLRIIKNTKSSTSKGHNGISSELLKLITADVQYRSASLSINPASRAGACTDCEYIECTIAIIIIVILVRSLFLVY